MMKEWDLDAYVRKFHRTITFFEDIKSKQVSTLYVQELGPDPGGGIFFAGYAPDGQVKTLVERSVLPCYRRVEPGFYTNAKTGKPVALWRKIVRSYQVGVSNHNHVVKVYDGKASPFEYTDLLKPWKVDVEKALSKGGPISRRLYLDDTNVWYLGQHVGFRKGTKFFVDDYLCQELKDSLRGTGCSIVQ